MRKRFLQLCSTIIFITLLSSFSSYGRTVMAWVSACDLDDSRNALQERWDEKGGINVLGLQWWLPDGKGGLVYSDDWDQTDTSISHPSDTTVRWFKKFAASQGMKVYMCIFNCKKTTWDPEMMRAAITTYKTSTINAIDALLTKLELDGVDLDLEDPTCSQNQSSYATFVKELYAKVNPKGKKVSICVFASDNGGHPGASWPTSCTGYFDHVMSMGYNWAGAGTGISYESLYSAAGSPSGKFCVGVNADDSTGLAEQWGSATAQEHVQSIAGMSNVGLCIWTSAVKGSEDGSVWKAPPIWNTIKGIANKTVTYDTATPSPNLVPLLKYYTSTDTKGSTATVATAGGVVTGTIIQKGSIDKDYFANFNGQCTNDFTGVKCIKLTYSANKPFAVELYQASLDSTGECFQTFVMKSASYTTVYLNVNSFYQPWWGNKVDNLDMAQVNGLIFDPLFLESAGGKDTIRIKEIVCYGRTGDWTTPVVNPLKPISKNQLAISLHSSALTYWVPQDGIYTIEIYRTNGSIVRSLSTGSVLKGEHTLTNVSSNFAPGLYYAHLKGPAGSAVSSCVSIGAQK